MLSLLLSFCCGSLANKVALGGLWSDAASWCPPGAPQHLDNVTIPAGADVLFDAQTPRLGWLVVEESGALRFQDGAVDDPELHLQAESILIYGYLEIGRQQSPLSRRATVTLVAHSIPPSRLLDHPDLGSSLSQPYGQKMLAVAGNGVWEAHATGRSPTWTKLDSSAPKDATSVTLAAAVDWRVGDEIIIASSDFAPRQTERVTVTAVSVDRRTLSFQPPLRYNHYSVRKDYFGFDVDMRVEVGVLTSNVRIEGDMTNSPTSTPEEPVDSAGQTYLVQFGGHTIYGANSFVRLEGLEFAHMGQGARMARYPIHWHLRGAAQGQYAKRCLVHDSFSRGITVHGTQELLLEDNVVYNVTGHAVYLEDGTETWNQFYRNLVVSSQQVGAADDFFTGAYMYPECSIPQPGLRLQYLDYQPAGFFITNVNNTFVGNVAVGHHWGFWVRVDPLFAEPTFRVSSGCATCCPAGDDQCSCKTAWAGTAGPNDMASNLDLNGEGLVLVDNVAHSNLQSGWWIKENWRPTNEDNNLIDGLLLYKNFAGVVNYGFSNLKFRRLILVDHSWGVQADWQREGTHTYLDSLIMCESDNFGNLEAVGEEYIPAGSSEEAAGELTVVTSTAFPGAERLWVHSQLGHWGFRFLQGQNRLENSVIANCRAPETWATPGNLYFDDYQGQNHVGAFQLHKRNYGSIAKLLDRVYFNNTPVVLSPMRGTKVSSSNKLAECLPPRLLPAGASCWDYGYGFRDHDGSLPCSAPGAYWISNTPAVVTPECEYRSSVNMFYCPPGEYFYYQLYVWPRIGWNGWNMPSGSFLALDWECDKRIEPVDDRFSVRSDKQYTVRLLSDSGESDTPYASLPEQIGLVFHTNSGEDGPNANTDWATFPENITFVFKLDGVWESEFFLRDVNIETNPSSRPIINYDERHLSRCRCDQTWIQVRLAGLDKGPWKLGVAPRNGWEVHATKSNTRICEDGLDGCGNPFSDGPEPAYCSQATSINDQDLTACSMRAVPSEARAWVQRPVATNGQGPLTSYVPTAPPPFELSSARGSGLSCDSSGTSGGGTGGAQTTSVWGGGGEAPVTPSPSGGGDGDLQPRSPSVTTPSTSAATRAASQLRARGGVLLWALAACFISAL